LNYSEPARAYLRIITPWYANMAFIVPGGALFVGLLGWAFVARSLVTRRKREAEQLRDQLLEEERRAREVLERQIAETKRAEASVRESQELYHSLVDNIPHLVIRKDLNGVYTYINSFTGHWLGIRLSTDTIGKTDFDIFPPELAERIQTADRHVMATSENLEGENQFDPQTIRTRTIGMAGSPQEGTRYYHWVRVPIRDGSGRVAGVQVIAWDVTPARQAAEELRVAKEQADEANKAKSTFLANMSHELRTPLNAILGYSEMLQEEASDTGQTAFIPDLQKIHGAGRHLLGLINDVLDLSKIEAGKTTLYLETFDVARLVSEVAATVQPLVDRNKNQLVVECSESTGCMRADLTKVRQVLFNLLSNASKFTEKGAITLSVERSDSLKSGISNLRFRVADTGIGMTPGQMSKLFEAFSQADASTSRKYGGTGLGLAISRKFCELMGGDLTVESEPGHGSTFTVTLPEEVRETVGTLAPVETQNSAKETASTSQGPTVLVIDDDPAVLDLMKRSLTRDGFCVELAADGKTGLELAARVKLALITLDVMMPGVDGWAVLTALKANPATADIPIIMMTIVDDRQMGFSLGAADYFTKPIDWQRLHLTLKKYRTPANPQTVLIVEDDASTREMLRRTLEKDGWQVAEAANGRVGLERLDEATPALILLDLMMPEMDGFEFMDALRQRKDDQRSPVIVITAKDLTEEDRERLYGGVERIIQKGATSPVEVLELIRVTMGSRAGETV
jgi:signal transduction histidine kinase/DNA-binding response OmpR family regulator